MNASLSPPSPAPARPLRAHGWRLLDQISVYLPVLLMGILAMGSYWLLRATPEPQAPTTERAITGDPDYFMRGFSVRSFDNDGRLSSEVRGTELRHYPETDAIQIDQARIRSIGSDGQLSRAEAIMVTTTGDQREFQLRGDALLVREALRLPDGQSRPRLELRSEYLRIHLDEDIVETDQPVQLQRDNDRLSADKLRHDNASGVTEMSGRVRAILQPRS